MGSLDDGEGGGPLQQQEHDVVLDRLGCVVVVSIMSFSTVWGGCAVDGVIAFVKTIHCHCIAGA